MQFVRGYLRASAFFGITVMFRIHALLKCLPHLSQQCRYALLRYFMVSSEWSP